MPKTYKQCWGFKIAQKAWSMTGFVLFQSRAIIQAAAGQIDSCRLFWKASGQLHCERTPPIASPVPLWLWWPLLAGDGPWIGRLILTDAPGQGDKTVWLSNSHSSLLQSGLYNYPDPLPLGILHPTPRDHIQAGDQLLVFASQTRSVWKHRSQLQTERLA